MKPDIFSKSKAKLCRTKFYHETDKNQQFNVKMSISEKEHSND